MTFRDRLESNDDPISGWPRLDLGRLIHFSLYRSWVTTDLTCHFAEGISNVGLAKMISQEPRYALPQDRIQESNSFLQHQAFHEENWDIGAADMSNTNEGSLGVITVAQLNTIARDLLENSKELTSVWVS